MHKSCRQAAKLILCPDCDREISRRTAACPSCGFPISANGQTAELTAKAWKRRMLVAVGILFAGIFLSCIDPLRSLGWAVIAYAVVYLLSAKWRGGLVRDDLS